MTLVVVPFTGVFAAYAAGRVDRHRERKPISNSTPEWSPDGRELAFSSNRTGKIQIFVMNADGSNQHHVTRNRRGDSDSPAWSPDGRKIAFEAGYSCGTISEQIFVVNPDGSDQRQLTRAPKSSVCGSFTPAWSPDGRKIAFSSNRTGFFRIFVMKADGTNPKRLTRGKAGIEDEAPVWSPDGRQIAFMRGSSTPPQTDQIYVMKADGSDPRQLTHRGFNAYPSWSRDGRKLVFVNVRDQGQVNAIVQIYVMNADGSDRRQLTRSGLNAFPRWSPDGRKIAFVREDRGNDQIYVMNADGSNQHAITHK